MFSFTTWLWLPSGEMQWHHLSNPPFTVLLRNLPYMSWTEDESGGMGLRCFDQWSPPVHFKFGCSIFFLLKVPSSLLTSAKLSISLFNWPLAIRHGPSVRKSIVGDWEGEYLPWPSLPQSVTRLIHPSTRTHNTRKWGLSLPVVPTPLIPATILICLEVLQGQGSTVCVSGVSWCCQIKFLSSVGLGAMFFCFVFFLCPCQVGCRLCLL